MKLTRTILPATALFLLFTFAIVSVRNYLNLPLVHVTYPDHRCVKVVPEEAGSCERLPKKYEEVFVASEELRRRVTYRF